jgi:hypothetical protein
MDSTRISIAQLLALDVPLAWQDAVAVAHEVAMLNDVSAAMNARPPLVTPETCYLTRTGEVELPETADTESPEAVTDLLRLMLAGREAPEALEDLVFGHHSRDLSSDLAAFSGVNRHAVIAKLVTRALAKQASASPSVVGAVAPPATPLAAPPVPSVLSDDPPRELTRPVLVKPAPQRTPDDAGPVVASLPPPFQAMPPFRASPLPKLEPALPSAALARAEHRETPRDAPHDAPSTSTLRGAERSATASVGTTASDLELRRLRRRQADKAEPPLGSWAGLGRRLARWITWRPSVLDPLVTGATIIVTAAFAVFLWQRGATSAGRPAAPPARATSPSKQATSSARAEVTAPVPAIAAPAAGGVGSGTVGERPTAPVNSPSPTTSATPRRSAETGAAAPASSDVTLSPAPRRGQPTLVVRRSTPVPPPAESFTAAPASPESTAITPRESITTSPDVGSTVVPAETPPGVAPALREGRDEGRRAAPSRTAFYSSNDADVEPPVMRRQHLPSAVLEPTADVPDDWPFLELLIDPQGAVEQVRLHARQLAPGQTMYRHRMLLAAAKAWQFEPARRNGEPVRYVMRVPLEP